MNRLLYSPKIKLKPLPLHSVSTVHFNPNSYNLFNRKLSINLSRTNLHSATSVFVPNSTSVFSNKPFVKLSPIKPHILNKYNIKLPLAPGNMNSGHRSFPSISKCNRKRCCTCKYLSSNSVIKSNSNGRNFSVVLASDVS
jgi:hypothetical protein